MKKNWGILLLLIVAVLGSSIIGWRILEDVRSRGGKWQVLVKQESTEFVVVIENPERDRSRTLIFNGAEIGPAEPERYFFPDDAKRFPYGEIIFFDHTFLPGRVTFSILGGEVDVMERNLIVNGIEYDWSEPEPIRIRTRPEQDSDGNAEKPPGDEPRP
jgi:hypothetical protein